MEQSGASNSECKHCKQPIIDLVISDDGQSHYCCYGCKVVDELLTEHRGIVDGHKLDHSKYAYLDEDGVQQKLLSFKDGHYARISIHLPAIHCSSCIYLLESLPEIEEGIMEVQVHFAKRQANITYRTDQIPLSRLASLLDYIGYTPDFQTQLQGAGKKRNLLLMQLGVAGFFFGNTMLLALPEYLDASLSADGDLQRFFRYLMMLFSLPVIAFSARDYFINAYKTLRAGVLSIDLPVALGISVLFIRSSYEVISGFGPGYFDSLSGLVFFLLIGKWYQQKTYRNFTFDRDFRSFLPLASNLVLENGKEKPISVDELGEGDVIVLRKGEVLPADGILAENRAEVDYSYITGESIPIQKKEGEGVYAGARIIDGAVKFTLKGTVDHSYLSSLWSKEAFEAHDKEGGGFTDRIARYFTPTILLIAIISAGIWSFFDMAKAMEVFAAVLIVACPCALALAEPFASGSMMRWFGRSGFFLKNANVLNRMSEIDQLVFDKTGTLTRQDKITVKWTGETLQAQDRLDIAAIAHNTQHSLARPLLRYLEVDPKAAGVVVNFSETSGEGVCATAAENIYLLGKAGYVGIEDTAESTAVYVQKNGKLIGYFSFCHQLREEAKEVITELKNDYPISLLSGDNRAEQKRFYHAFGSDVALHFDKSPVEKLEHLQRQQKRGSRVLMVGDGLNDAGALQQSEVGISLCEKNINFFPASDGLLLASSFGKLDKYLGLSRINQKVIYQAFALSLLYNLAGISLAVAGLLSPLISAILMPISSVSVVLFTTLNNRKWCRKHLDL